MRLFEAQKGLVIEVDPSAGKVLPERGYSPDLGARTLERAVNIGEFHGARRVSGTSAIQDGEIFRVGLTRLRLGGAKDERLVTAATAAIAKAKRS